jgi:hypothetical protein
MVEDVLAGCNATLLAYGSSGAGKTHTIMGPVDHWQGPQLQERVRQPPPPPRHTCQAGRPRARS